ncbi:MAG: type III-B CRISPR module RAMP protein Cmr4 [Xenococcaceae cyanobacterium]
MNSHLVYLYLLSPLHTGGTSQEGNIVGIAREVHTNFPYLPSSSIRGRLRADVDFVPDSNTKMSADDIKIEARIRRVQLFGPDLKDIQSKEFVEYYEVVTGRKLSQLEQGSIWIGDASLLWMPISSISHGVIWISCPLLLKRWMRLKWRKQLDVKEYSSNLPKKGTIYLKDMRITGKKLENFPDNKTWQDFVPNVQQTSIENVLVVPNRYCETLIEMSLWRQVKVKLSEHKVVTDGSFRYEEAIPPDALMYFPWGVTNQVRGDANNYSTDFKKLLSDRSVLQLGGEESLGRGFVQHWMDEAVQQQEEVQA